MLDGKERQVRIFCCETFAHITRSYVNRSLLIGLLLNGSRQDSVGKANLPATRKIIVRKIRERFKTIGSFHRCFDLVIKTLNKAVSDIAIEHIGNTFPMVSDGFGKFFDGLKSAMRSPEVPIFQQENRASLLSVAFHISRRDSTMAWARAVFKLSRLSDASFASSSCESLYFK